ncbi:SAM-dependent methyltransferase [Acidobacteriota bacterium]
MFEELQIICTRPRPFEFYTASELWTDEHTSKQMLSFHLNENIDASSRNTAFIDRSVEWIVSRFNIGAGAKVADFGCGPGLYTTRLARRQAAVTGIDFSKRSIQHARGVAASEGLSIHYLNQNYFEFESDERFQLILMIMCDFCALSPGQRSQMLKKIYGLLESGGSFLLDVYSLATFMQREEKAIYEANLLDGFWASSKYYGFLNTFKYCDEKLILDKYTIVEASRTRTIYNWLQCFTPETLEAELAKCGLTADKYYSDVAGSPYNPEGTEFAVVAKKM